MTIKEKAIYNKYGIQINGDKLISPNGVTVAPFLKCNNTKVNGDKKERKASGTWTRKKICWTYGILPTDMQFHSDLFGDVKGTCACTCTDKKGKIACYACLGNYKRYPEIMQGIITKTVLVRMFPEWVKNAIMAQLEIIGENVNIRLHDSGDFDSIDYLNMWHDIIKAFPNNHFWTYTKRTEWENAFDDLSNANIVRSIIPNVGYNFGHVRYILSLYRYLVSIGEKPFLCKCGMDKNQHCWNCSACIENKYVLFLEHGTDYKAEKDALYPIACAVADMQGKFTVEQIAEYIVDNLPM